VHLLMRTLGKAISTSDLRQVLTDAPVALAIVTVVALALGWLAAGRVLRPLATITAAARRISASNLHQRLALRRPHHRLQSPAPRPPAPPPGRRLRRPAALRRQRLPRTAHPPHPGARPAAGRAR